MNEKTAKLIRKFAEKSGENERDIKRRWNVMNQDQRHQFRLQMKEQVGLEAAAGGDAEE
ncbi:MAG TPA: hypothetical protein RMG48_13590 [Myxococcales bacterium LLY-WYZ-16_1]|jgi:hypothetical protein|nr:hypothetical protein [Myxococcales bacterium LLY-WYZ-16_1]